jgi:hypothetical protein
MPGLWEKARFSIGPEGVFEPGDGIGNEVSLITGRSTVANFERK